MTIGCPIPGSFDPIHERPPPRRFHRQNGGRVRAGRRLAVLFAEPAQAVPPPSDNAVAIIPPASLAES